MNEPNVIKHISEEEYNKLVNDISRASAILSKTTERISDIITDVNKTKYSIKNGTIELTAASAERIVDDINVKSNVAKIKITDSDTNTVHEFKIPFSKLNPSIVESIKKITQSGVEPETIVVKTTCELENKNGYENLFGSLFSNLNL